MANLVASIPMRWGTFTRPAMLWVERVTKRQVTFMSGDFAMRVALCNAGGFAMQVISFMWQSNISCSLKVCESMGKVWHEALNQ